MTMVFVLLVGLYNPDLWLHFPAMDEIRSVSAGSDRLYIAVPSGVYILDRSDYRLIRTLTAADGVKGSVRLCAFNPVRGDLFILAGDKLYQYLDTPDEVFELFPPFKHVNSIGISVDAAYFDTEQGFFRKERLLDRYEKTETLPTNIVWYGSRDTSKPEDYVFLVPYYFADNQLNNHRMTLVYRDPKARRLYVAAKDYGLMVYSTNLGLSERHIRMGPTQDPISRVVFVDDRLWFQGRDWTVSLDQHGKWSYFRTRLGDLPAFRATLLFASLLDLARRESLTAFLPVPESRTAWVGTHRALYSIGPKGKLTRVLNLGLAVNGLAQLGDSLLIGTDAGLYVWYNDSLNEVLDPFGRTGFGVYSMVQTERWLWIGTLGGLVVIERVCAARRDSSALPPKAYCDSATDRVSGFVPDSGPCETEIWQQVIPPGFDLSRPVRGLAAYANTVFYDNGSGITALTLSDMADAPGMRDRTYLTIDRSSGLPHNDITAMYADERYLWIATPGTISRFDYRLALR